MPNMTASTQRQSREVEVFAIHSDEDLDRALEEINRLMDLEEPTQDQRDRLEVLTTLVEAYEEQRSPIPPPTAIEAIKFRLDQMGFTSPSEQTKALVPVLGSRSRVYEVMHKRRGLSAQMIIKLWRKFDIPLESLITGATLRRKRRTNKAINGVTGHAKKRTNKDALY